MSDISTLLVDLTLQVVARTIYAMYNMSPFSLLLRTALALMVVMLTSAACKLNVVLSCKYCWVFIRVVALVRHGYCSLTLKVVQSMFGFTCQSQRIPKIMDVVGKWIS